MGSLSVLLRSVGLSRGFFKWEELHDQILFSKRSHGICVEKRLE